MGFAAMVLLGENVAKSSKFAAIVVGVVFTLWFTRGMENYLNYHMFHRIDENSTHSYRDDRECARLPYQMQYTRFPLEGADVAILAGRRFTRRMASEQPPALGNPAVKRKEVVALEAPWPQICYAMRPRPIILGYPFENFWGPAEYRRFESVPLDADGKATRPPRRAYDFLRDKGVKYVVTPLTLSKFTALTEADAAYGNWLDSKGFEPSEYSSVREVDLIAERGDNKREYHKPQFVHVYELKFPDKAASAPSAPKDK
jgi:hypothetical protein